MQWGGRNRFWDRFWKEWSRCTNMKLSFCKMKLPGPPTNSWRAEVAPPVARRGSPWVGREEALLVEQVRRTGPVLGQAASPETLGASDRSPLSGSPTGSGSPVAMEVKRKPFSECGLQRSWLLTSEMTGIRSFRRIHRGASAQGLCGVELHWLQIPGQVTWSSCVSRPSAEYTFVVSSPCLW